MVMPNAFNVLEFAVNKSLKLVSWMLSYTLFYIPGTKAVKAPILLVMTSDIHAVLEKSTLTAHHSR